MKIFSIVLLGTSEFTLTCYRSLKAAKQDVKAIISTPRESSPLNSVDIKSFCKKEKILYFEAKDLHEKTSLDFLDSMQPDFIFSTWPFIIASEVMQKARYGVIGSHPTKIPQNRGRHPIHWMIDFGSTSTELSFFHMDEGVDTGTIIHQQKFRVYPKKDIQFTLDEMNKAAAIGIKNIFQKKTPANKKSFLKQNHKKANYLRKRNAHDSVVDLRMRGEDLLALHHSFAPPYPGISFVWGAHVFKVQKMTFKDLPKDMNQSMEHGKVIKASGKKLICKCRDGKVELLFDKAIPLELLTKKYVMPPTYYLTKNPEALASLLG